MIEIVLKNESNRLYHENISITFSNGKLIVDDGITVESFKMENVIKLKSYC